MKGGTSFLCPTRQLWLVEWALAVILSQIAVVQEWVDVIIGSLNGGSNPVLTDRSQPVVWLRNFDNFGRD